MLVGAGAFVWVNDIYEDRAAKVAADLGGDVHAKPVKADVTSPDKIARDARDDRARSTSS